MVMWMVYYQRLQQFQSLCYPNYRHRYHLLTH
jgi:hypothetical protein